ncbi:hypothetical protein FJ934_21840 [Mesorhizobium sp. B2-4-12]|uniref:hypothetical protein n=1 Tax=unclassified Mesorhizobium TaxID=325217 RepID=UPI00112C93DD|nr:MULTISPECIES: hypothetical protein [unclassified Mesorhizobium]TPK91642.1 hypothetical protein FJ934_21840 [Mesorhizobium sp. B2-4-12]TPK98948.1 hypothetical protein FJ938_24600 [Mesorhizobium sp. B2-4-14]
MNRASVLGDLVRFAKPVDHLAETIGVLGWSDTPVVMLTAYQIVSVLQRARAGALTAADVEAWADLIECREDIEYQPEHHEEILQAIYMLANPVLNGSLDEALTDQLIASLLP